MEVAPWVPDHLTIPAFPEAIRDVPTDPIAWAVWKRNVLKFRKELRRRATLNEDVQRQVYAAAASDPVFFMCIFAIVHEPRWRDDRPPGFREWIPYAFQVELVRWFQWVIVQRGMRGHGLVEKCRDMGATWTFSLLAAHAWLFAESALVGMSSRNKDEVETRGDYGAIFSKVRSALTIEPGVPPDMQLPDYIFPSGFVPRTMDNDALLIHPYKANRVTGETTTKNTGRGTRELWHLNDEAAFNAHYGAAKSAQFNTTDHIFSISTASLDDGGVFRDECEDARLAITEGRPSQSLIRLDWWVHPHHDDAWYEEQKSIFLAKKDPHGFEREIEINYYAGSGEHVYEEMEYVEVGPYPYVPGAGPVYVAIDPGVSDAAAVLVLQYKQRDDWIDVVEAFSISGVTAEFFGALFVGAYPDNVDIKKARLAAPFADFMRSISDPIEFVGDPAGNQRSGDGKSTWYKTCGETAYKISGGRRNVIVKTKYDEEATGFVKRIGDAKNLLPRTRWNDTPGVKYALHCMKNAKFPKLTERSTERLEPKHDHTSHNRSAFEYFSVNFRIGRALMGLSRDVQFVNVGGSLIDDERPMFAVGMDIPLVRHDDAPEREDGAWPSW